MNQTQMPSRRAETYTWGVDYAELRIMSRLSASCRGAALRCRVAAHLPRWNASAKDHLCNASGMLHGRGVG